LEEPLVTILEKKRTDEKKMEAVTLPGFQNKDGSKRRCELEKKARKKNLGEKFTQGNSLLKHLWEGDFNPVRGEREKKNDQSNNKDPRNL